MPSRKDENGTFRDIAHPITSTARQALEGAILAQYAQYMEGLAAQAESIPPPGDADMPLP